MGEVLCHQIFRDLLFNACDSESCRCRSFYRAFEPKEISFFRENHDAIQSRASSLETALFFLDQNFAFAGVIGLADDAFEFHPLHQ